MSAGPIPELYNLSAMRPIGREGAPPMKITIAPTGQFQRVNGEPARIWVGHDEHGIAVVAHVRVVSPQSHDPVVNERYERALIDLGAAEHARPLALDMCHVGGEP